MSSDQHPARRDARPGRSGEIVLVVDDVDRNHALEETIGAVWPCAKVGRAGAISRSGAPILAVVSDIDLGRLDTAPSLYTFLTHCQSSRIPHLNLLRRATFDGRQQARALGAGIALPAGSPAALIVNTLYDLIDPRRLASSEEAQLVRHRAVEVAGVFGDMFATLRAGGRIGPSAIASGTDLVLQAVQEGRVGDWLEVVWDFDNVTFQHCLLVAGVAACFASELGFGLADGRRLVQGALLHDVGKARIPTEILNKRGRLTVDEMSVMRTHALLGYEMLVPGGFDAELLSVVRGHHELLDGSGYPDGLKGDEISDLVRLVTICDVYSALIEHRPYRAAMDNEHALAILASKRGKLDPDLLRAFQPVARHCELRPPPV